MSKRHKFAKMVRTLPIYYTIGKGRKVHTFREIINYMKKSNKDWKSIAGYRKLTKKIGSLDLILGELIRLDRLFNTDKNRKSSIKIDVVTITAHYKASK